jgi:AAA+ superfamily predicted ATPase
MDDTIQALRKALEQSPDNVPLRAHLADYLLSHGYAREAETEYREAIALAPEDKLLQLGLARAFFHQGKNLEALVIVERLSGEPETGGDVRVMHSWLLVRTGDIEGAVRQYRQALEMDPSLFDDELSNLLNLFPDRTSGSSPSDVDEVFEGRVRSAHEFPSEPVNLELEKPDINFNDVGGMEHVKDEIQNKIILPLDHPELYETYGKKVGGGILMYGPPGCGKTHLARATAGAVNANFLSLGIHDVLDMWIGQSERKLHAIFEHARENTPCILFFDEIDALGASRADMRRSAGRQQINQFLAEMDGLESSNEGILILGATNAPWHLDPAFRRPGRFDRVIFVPPPDQKARVEICRIMLRGKPVGDIDHERVAKKTTDFSGADLKAVVDRAIEAKLRKALRSNRPEPIITKDLLESAKKHRPTTREWFATARNYALYSNEGGIYDDIVDYLKLR